MSIITNPITPQSFEIVRDRLGEILDQELSSQAILTDDDRLDAAIYLQRSKEFTANELPAVNISLDNGVYTNHQRGVSDAIYTFHIDCYAAAEDSESATGDILASLDMQRLLGVCRSILSNPVYRNLGFAAPFTNRVTVTGLTLLEVKTTEESSIAGGRLSVDVAVQETTALLNAAISDGHTTKIQLGTTLKGYQYE